MAHADIRTSALKNPLDLAEYLFRRVRELGVRSVHGVPGDYNLAALDYIPKVGLNWVGNCNELNAGDFNVFANMFTQVSVAVARLNDPYDAAEQIDFVLQQCMIRSRPVYITLPTDMVQAKVEGERLKTPIDVTIPKNNPDVEDYVVGVILKYLHAAKDPTILVDACASRHGVLDEVHELVEKTRLPTFVAPMGKGAVDETLPNYGGVYAGDVTPQGIKTAVENSGLVLSIGAIKSDFNTSGFSYRISQLSTIDFHSTFIKVKYSEYPNIHMKGVLRKVIDNMDLSKIRAQPAPPAQRLIPDDEGTSKDQTITQSWLWSRVGKWFQPNDIGERGFASKRAE
ncbi:hypothetical protein GP486_007726 [Trichoglossum hirsutum]|uniref:Pyruvate decarboxylase n=1 Tax=Trichoglossum hirsutum TaxID=265104 RepID=A0A9P8IJA6_9PEZI|nr:hypothetical protein GP486_007726 [Trichoglossum hirsutum]